MTKNEKEKKNEIYVTISSKVGWMQVNWNQSYSFAKKNKILTQKVYRLTQDWICGIENEWLCDDTTN